MKPSIRAKRKAADISTETPPTTPEEEPTVHSTDSYHRVVVGSAMTEYILIRISNISKLIEYSNTKSSGVRLHGELIFKDGTPMRFAAFKDEARLCFSKLQQGRMYRIKAKLVRPLIKYSDEPLEVTFGANCDIASAEPQPDFPDHVFKPTSSIEDIVNLKASEKDISRFTDVLAVIVNIHGVTRTKEHREARCVEIADQSQKSITINFYGEQVQLINSFNIGDMMYFRSLKITSYGSSAKPSRILEYSSVSYFKNAAALPYSQYVQTNKLQQWWQSADPDYLESISLPMRAITEGSNIVTVKQVKEECSQRNIAGISNAVVQVTISKIITDNSAFTYKACNRVLSNRTRVRCNKKATPSTTNSTHWTCSDGHAERTATDVLKLQLLLKDSKSDDNGQMDNIIEVAAFGKAAEAIIGIPLSEYVQEEPEALPELHMEISEYCSNKRFRMELKCQTVVDGRPRYTVADAAAIDKDGQLEA